MTRTARTRLLAVVGALIAIAALACAASAFWTPAASSGPAAAAAATVAAGADADDDASPRGARSPSPGPRRRSRTASPSTATSCAATTPSAARPPPSASGCTGTVAATSCVEAAVPPGTWRYTVTPLIGVNWRGAESPRSGIVTVGAATLTLATTQFGGPAAFPRTTTGTLAGFAANEGITYRLDAATALVGSPSSAGPAGTAAITSLAIPAVADGPHTVWAIGNATVPSQASATIVVDRTAPTVSASAAPAPNGAGWNTSAPVTVTLTANDGTGVGGGQIRYTTDGSDPTVSGTAQTYAAPLSLNATTTVRFAASDALGQHERDRLTARPHRHDRPDRRAVALRRHRRRLPRRRDGLVPRRRRRLVRDRERADRRRVRPRRKRDVGARRHGDRVDRTSRQRVHPRGRAVHLRGVLLDRRHLQRADGDDHRHRRRGQRRADDPDLRE